MKSSTSPSKPEQGLVLRTNTSALEENAESFAELLERHNSLVLIFFTAVFFCVTLVISTWRPFWYDELFTLYISKLSSIAAIRSALANAVDQLPLPYYLITRTSQSVLGGGELGTRFPSAIGFWIGCLCVFEIVRRRTSALYGWVAVLAILTSSFAYRYAYEARPYGLIFGFGALALLSWQRATEGPRIPYLATMAASLLVSTCSHYYAILLLCPLALGEITRTVMRRRIDVAVWLAMCPAFTPFPFAHISKNASTYSNFWSAPKLSFFLSFHERLLHPLVLPAVALMFVLTAWFLIRGGQRWTTREVKQLPPAHELVAAFGFVILPIFGYLLAVLVTNALAPRYVLPAIVGFAIFCAYFIYFAARGAAVIGIATLVVLVCGTGMNTVLYLRGLTKNGSASVRMALPQAATEQGGPIVIENPLFFFEATHRSDHASRLRYLVDPETANKYPYTYLDPGIPLLSEVAPVKVERFSEFTSRNSQFIVYRRADSDYGNGWVIRRLLDEGARIELLDSVDTSRVYRVTMTSQSGNTAHNGRPAR